MGVGGGVDGALGRGGELVEQVVEDPDVAPPDAPVGDDIAALDPLPQRRRLHADGAGGSGGVEHLARRHGPPQPARSWADPPARPGRGARCFQGPSYGGAAADGLAAGISHRHQTPALPIGHTERAAHHILGAGAVGEWALLSRRRYGAGRANSTAETATDRKPGAPQEAGHDLRQRGRDHHQAANLSVVTREQLVGQH